jgi:chromosome segregation ATPase
VSNLTEIEENIEIANALLEQTAKAVDMINRLIAIIDQYKNTVNMALQQRNEMIEVLKTCEDERDRARATAVRLEQECHSCADTVHHGNEEVYDGAI